MRHIAFTVIALAAFCTLAQAQAPAPAPSPAAEAARLAVAAGLKDRADTLFADDRRLELDPMLKAAGVWVRRSRVQARVARR